MSKSSSSLAFKTGDDTPPPFLGSWKRVYISILAYLAALILVLYALTRAFSYN